MSKTSKDELRQLLLDLKARLDGDDLKVEQLSDLMDQLSRFMSEGDKPSDDQKRLFGELDELSGIIRQMKSEIASLRPDDIKALVQQVLADHEADAELTTAMATALDAANWPGDVIVTVLPNMPHPIRARKTSLKATMHCLTGRSSKARAFRRLTSTRCLAKWRCNGRNRGRRPNTTKPASQWGSGAVSCAVSFTFGVFHFVEYDFNI